MGFNFFNKRQINNNDNLFPYIISPAPGCPLLVDKNAASIDVIIAASHRGISGDWQLRPAAANGDATLANIDLQADPASLVELDDIDSGYLISDLAENRQQLSKTVLRLFGPDTLFYKLTLRFATDNPGPRSRASILYDLHLHRTDGSTHIKHHSVCLLNKAQDKLKFTQVTDLHLARRNDLIEAEVSIEGPVENFNNFNDNLRRMIRKLNTDYDNGELDFVILSGDLIDFVYHGASHQPEYRDNNWRLFYEIITGTGQEYRQGNPGCKAPVFTSTGNHDWTLFPYDISYKPHVFGIPESQKAKAELFDHQYYSSKAEYRAILAELYNKVISGSTPLNRANHLITVIKLLLRFVNSWRSKNILPVLAVLYATTLDFDPKYVWLYYGLIYTVTYATQRVLFFIAEHYIKRVIGFSVIPTIENVTALYDYFLNINPYFNYTFSFGENHFIVVDTGADCLVAEELWDDGKKKLNKIGLTDLIGGSPDSQAFFRLNEYYNIAQITWLDNILNLIRQATSDKRRIILIAHAPPINTKNPPVIPAGQNEVVVKADARYGTINHYLSQFYSLCRGKKEGYPDYTGPGIDLVLSGHTHYVREFRIGEHNRIYAGQYSQAGEVSNFDQVKPLILQTAACGPMEPGFVDTPYYRTVSIDQHGKILDLSHRYHRHQG
ncbi:MAG: metallophosphoesterase [Gammaproteobacteria bacterium]|nr:metallophosphoesterase [Gammaproteobacteria bacterium]MDH5651048.1 metallophosphoesterase [Gammaproteobacteria bacterium]